MKAKFGAIVVAASGKLGGHVASRNRAGAYFRTKVTPVNPQTSYQNTVRNRLGTLSQAWRALDDEQRAAWNAAVQSFAKTDIFGDLKNPTGFNLYQRINNNLGLIGQAAIDTPPVPAETATRTISTLVAEEGGASMVLTMSGTVPANTYAVVRVTPQVSPGISFVKSEYRVLQLAAPAAAAAISLGSAFITRFGAFIAGQKIFVSVTYISSVTGLPSLPVSISTIVAP